MFSLFFRLFSLFLIHFIFFFLDGLGILFIHIRLCFIIQFLGHEILSCHRQIKDYLSALVKCAIELFNSLETRVVLFHFHKGKPSRSLFIRMHGDVNLLDLPEWREQFSQMLFIDVKHKVPDNYSVAFGSFLTLLDGRFFRNLIGSFSGSFLSRDR